MSAKNEVEPGLDDRVSLVTQKMMDGDIDDLTFIQTMASIFDAWPKSTNPRTYVNGLRRHRRRLLDLICTELKQVGRISKKIHMIEQHFKD